MNTYINKKRNILLTVFALIACICFSATLFCYSASASVPQAQLYLPQTNLEYQRLTSPIDVYSDDVITAIAQNTLPNNSLLLYCDGQYLSSDKFSSIKQVRRLDQSSLIVSDNGTIYSVLIDGSFTKTEMRDNQSYLIGGNFFDLNENHLVTAYGGKAYVYDRTPNGFDLQGRSFVVSGDSPVVINGQGDIFFVNGNGLCKTNVNSLTHTETLLQGVSIDKMIADNNFIYFVDNTKIFKLSTAGGSAQQLTVTGIDAQFDLGNIYAPQGIAFKGNNLLIIDGDTVQEFQINEDKLLFTGFAIAKGKTAYNRIASSALDVEKYDDTLAVLDNYKLTVINTASADKYARENYKNYIKGANSILGVYMPDLLALGNGSVLLTYDKGTATGSLKLLNLSNDVISDSFTIDNSPVIRDICYQSGYYYILSDNGSAPSNVYKVSETDFSLTSENKILTTDPAFQAYFIEVDVYGEVFLSTTTSIIKYNKADDYRTALSCASATNIQKLCTDLSGGLFVLDSGNIYYYFNNSLNLIDLNASLSTVKTFAIDFIKKQTFLLYDNEELVMESNSLPNLALSEFEITADYITSASNANLNTLKIYQAKQGANVYIVQKDLDKFIFNSLTPSGEKYVYICTIEQTNEYGVNLSVLALAGQNHVVLVDLTQAEDVSDSTLNLSDAPASAFVTTGVNGYYFPIITKNGEYSLSDAQTIRINKGSQINPQKTITFLDKEYYFASFIFNGATHTGYIPKDFTVEILSEDFTWNEYSIQTLNKTVLYSDRDATIEIMQLEDGQQVRLKEKLDNVCLVIVSDGNGGFIEGYVQSSSIKNEPNKAIRNILIILAVTACVCGTTTYFILRRKVG